MIMWGGKQWNSMSFKALHKLFKSKWKQKMFFVRISIKKNSKQREEEKLAWELVGFCFLLLLLLFPTFLLFSSWMPSVQAVTLPSPTNLIYFDICFKLQRDASYDISQRLGCIENVNRIQYFITVSFMKVTPVSRDCGITLVLKVTLSVVFSFQRCQRTIIIIKRWPAPQKWRGRERETFVCLFVCFHLA